MENRKYNIFFHLHTVSGIVISAVLFVIFFAGSFAFFRDDINNWQHNQSAADNEYLLPTANFKKTLFTLDTAFVMQGRTVEFSRPYAENFIVAHMDPTSDSLADKKARIHEYVYFDARKSKFQTYEEGYALGEFLYRLHFLAQIPYPYGYYLAGFTALFFLFAIITGVLVHWKKIVSHFYTFRPKEKLKTLWTDAHTALGMIGLPFQFVYALTGAFFLINIFLVAPSVGLFYGGDSEKLYADLGYMNHRVEFANKRISALPDMDALAKTAEAQFPDFHLTALEIQHYGDANMRIIAKGMLDKSQKMSSVGRVVFDSDGKILAKQDPYETTSYLDTTRNLLYKLHYGDYAGYSMKIVSFIFGLITCFVIISGVMLWLVARDKKKLDEKKRRFNNAVVRIYLAISMTMFPITAATFLAVKLYAAADMTFLYSFYFIGWLLLVIGFLLKRSLAFTTKYNLLLGSILGFLVPIANGVATGNWFWKALSNDMFSMFFVDVLWIGLSLLGLYSFLRTKKSQRTQLS
ncbi:PepSY domain-containing protein [Flavobacterium sp.]|uniref:PepSY-associated TM helix domain-containing protein n=1 Tax=Flavobacterium sp. TaxID=239 RepID=UPI00121BF222|nr:PepSY-associated TM helix domain-containing protein [Flavobacterium sp.]RZJ73369.1 MAG: PepSY domain-containing protein [Flavobacterium sp.]